MREDLLRQFSSADGSNPLADFKAAHLRAAREASVRQEASLEAMREQMVALKLELAGLRSEREKLAAVDAEAARGTAKGRPYEEAVAEAVEAIARRRWATTATRWATSAAAAGARATCWSTSTAAPAPSRGRIVFEAKNSRRSRKEALEDLDAAMAQRAADYGVWVVPSESLAAGPRRRPARGRRRQAVRGLRPEDGSRLALEVAYSLARARVLMAKGSVDGLDAPALRAEVERALAAMDEVRRIKLHLTNAAGGIEQARAVLDGMAERVRAHLSAIDALVDAAEAE